MMVTRWCWRMYYIVLHTGQVTSSEQIDSDGVSGYTLTAVTCGMA